MEELVEQRQAELAMLDDVADMSIPKTINTYETEDDSRAQQVISPDGTSTFDGTSTIGSATSEPTTETASRASTRASNSKASKPSTRKSSSGKGSSRRSSRSSSKQSSPNQGGTKSGRSSGRNYSSRNNYGSSRMQQSVPRPFKRAGPLSYSKTVRLTGAGSPYSGREVDDKTRAVLADMNEFDANQAETE